MKKIFYLLAVGLLTCGVVACDNEPKNPGDFDLQSELGVGEMYSLLNGDFYPLEVERTYDTTFYSYRKFTSYNIDPQTGDTLGSYPDSAVYSVKESKIFMTNSVTLPALADTFKVNVISNARWNAPTPSANLRGQGQIYVVKSTGGGDGYMTFRTENWSNANTIRATNVCIITSDSSRIYMIPTFQLGDPSLSN